MINFIISNGPGLATLLLIMVFAASIIFSVISFAPWVPSRGRDLKRILKLADLKFGQSFYELGCGNGRVAVYAADNFPAKVVGLEIALPLYLICCFRKLFNRNGNLKFKFKNLYKENLSSADVVYFFGIPHSLTEKFMSKLKAELRLGTKVISYSFKLPGWTPKTVDKPTEKDLPIYVYEM